MNAVDLLKAESLKPRRYRCDLDFIVEVEYARSKCERLAPEKDWQDYLRIIEPGAEERLAIVETRPLICWGSANASVLTKGLAVELPIWMERFYEHVTCATLPMLNQIAMLTPEESLAYELDRRAQLDEQDLPCRLIRFADGDPTGAGFSLYKSWKDEVWRIVVTGFGTTTPTCEDDDWDYDYADIDIDRWMQRMFETDGHPLNIGGEEFEPMVCRRLP